MVKVCRYPKGQSKILSFDFQSTCLSISVGRLQCVHQNSCSLNNILFSALTCLTWCFVYWVLRQHPDLSLFSGSMAFPCSVRRCRWRSCPRLQMQLPWRYKTCSSCSSHKTWNTDRHRLTCNKINWRLATKASQ